MQMSEREEHVVTRDTCLERPVKTSLVPIKDRFCWDCHRPEVHFSCAACLRSYHHKCSSLKKMTRSDHQLCPECIGIERAEDRTNPSSCMQWLDGNVDRLSQLLSYTIETVKAADKNGSFARPVSREEYPEYANLVVNPMDLSLVADNIEKKVYASTNSFLADIKWIYHNCFVFNAGVNKELISEAKNVIRVAKQECEEIEICPDCYLNYYTLEEENYFAAVCRRPHAIVWAKLKGHPFWPAKVVRFNASKNEVDVRFFGTHDKCWLRPEKCYLMSQNYPNTKKPSKFDQTKFDAAIRDMNCHLDELDKHFKGLFQFHEKQTVFSVDKLYLEFGTNYPKENGFPAEKVLNESNQMSLKRLKVQMTENCLFDVVQHIDESGPNFEHVSTPKRVKRNQTKAKCISNAISVRQELNSSVDSSEKSFGDSELEAKEKHAFKDENQSNGQNWSPVGSKMVTVSGKSSQILNLNKCEVSEPEKANRSGLLSPTESVFVTSFGRNRNNCLQTSVIDVRAEKLFPDRIGNFINMVFCAAFITSFTSRTLIVSVIRLI